MYALLELVGLGAWGLARLLRIPVLRGRGIAVGVSELALLFVALHFRYLWTDWGAYDRKLEGLRLGAMFFLGGTYYLLRRYAWLHTAGFLALAMLLWLSRDHSRVLSVGYTLGLGYLVLYLAYVPGGWLRRYNRMGDYSYGLYIYAFPVQ